jgi:hypothetical protein
LTSVPKILIKTTGLPRELQRLALELGFDEDTISKLGRDWHLLCEAWVTAELALVRLGGSPSPPALEFKPPQCLVDWSLAHSKKQNEVFDFEGIGEQMARWWQRCTCDGISANIVLEKAWCKGGLSGIVLLVLGLKEWGNQIHGKAEHEKWIKVLLRVKSVFQEIPSADKL